MEVIIWAAVKMENAVSDPCQSATSQIDVNLCCKTHEESRCQNPKIGDCTYPVKELKCFAAPDRFRITVPQFSQLDAAAFLATRDG